MLPRAGLGTMHVWAVEAMTYCAEVAEMTPEQLLDLLSHTAPHGQFLWNNKQVVPVYVPGQKEPWAAVQTKKLDAVYLTLTGPKGCFALGRVTGLGHEPQLDGERGSRQAACRP